VIYLVFNVIFASAFMLSIKWVQVRNREDIITVGALNYIVAMMVLAPEFVQIRSESVTSGAMWTGAIMGVCYFVCYFFVIYAIKYIGASSATVVAVLSILLPITCGVFIWGEQPNMFQVIGILLALMSLMLIGGNSKKQRSQLPLSKNSLPERLNGAGELEQKAAPAPWIMPVVLLVFFLLAGTARLAQEAFKHVTTPEARPTFLFAAFVVSAIPSVALLAVRRRKISGLECVFGVLMGLANALQTHFILESLNRFDGFVVFPVTSAGGLILTTLVATRLLGENLNLRTYIGISIACIALVLLFWLPSGA